MEGHSRVKNRLSSYCQSVRLASAGPCVHSKAVPSLLGSTKIFKKNLDVFYTEITRDQCTLNSWPTGPRFNRSRLRDMKENMIWQGNMFA